MTVVVADTSVYVSALVFGGVPQAALIKALTVPFRVAVSHALRAELVETLERKFGWPSSRVAHACAHLWGGAIWCEPVAVQASRDPDDDHVLGCAIGRFSQRVGYGRQGPPVAASVQGHCHRNARGVSGDAVGGSP